MRAFRPSVPALLLPALLAACVAPVPPAIAPGTEGPATTIAESFLDVAARVEPVAEALCRRHSGPVNCDFVIAVDDRPGLPANAFQTLDRSGRPYIVFTPALIVMARNTDELAFVMGHEAAHHVAGHIPRRQSQAMRGAILAGVIAKASGLSDADVKAAQSFGADVGAQQYSKEFELEADALGAEIAFLAGYDPRRGGAFFDRLPDPGDQFLGTHPPNAQRKAIIEQTMQGISAP